MGSLPRSSSALDIAMHGSHHFGVLWGVLLAHGKFLEWYLKQWQLSRRPMSFISYSIICLEILTNIWRKVDAFSLFFRSCKLYYPLREWLKKCVSSYTMAWLQHLSPWNHWYKSESHLGSRTVYHQKILWKILDLFFFSFTKNLRGRIIMTRKIMGFSWILICKGASLIQPCILHLFLTDPCAAAVEAGSPLSSCVMFDAFSSHTLRRSNIFSDEISY